MLFIHIGLHKTGSSTIQHFAASNQPRLAECGIIYPGIGRSREGHINLAGELHSKKSFRPQRGGWDDIFKFMEENPGKQFLLSSEAFHILSRGAIQSLRSRLPPGDVRILAYVRDLATLTVSAYAQNAKTGHFTGNFDQFFANRLGSPGQSRLRYNGFAHLQAWADVFGWEAMRIRELDERHLEGGDLLTDFLDGLGIGWADLGPDVERGRRNVSPGWKAVELIRSVQAGAGGLKGHRGKEGYSAIRRSARAIHAAGSAVANRQGLNSEKGSYLTQEQLDVCDKLYTKFVDRLNSAVKGPPLPPRRDNGLRPRAFLPEPERVAEAERTAFYQGISVELARMLRAYMAPSSVEDLPEFTSEMAATKEEQRSIRRQERQRGKPKGKQAKASGGSESRKHAAMDQG